MLFKLNENSHQPDSFILQCIFITTSFNSFWYFILLFLSSCRVSLWYHQSGRAFYCCLHRIWLFPKEKKHTEEEGQGEPWWISHILLLILMLQYEWQGFITNISMLRIFFCGKTVPHNVYCPAVKMKGGRIGNITNTQLTFFARTVSCQTHEVLIISSLKYLCSSHFLILVQKQDKSSFKIWWQSIWYQHHAIVVPN